MEYILIEIAQFLFGITVIVVLLKKGLNKKNRLFLIFFGGTLLFLFLKDLGKTKVFIDQRFLMDNKEITSLELIPYKSRNYVTSIEKPLLFNIKDEIQPIVKELTDIESTDLLQPDKSKSFAIVLIDEKEKKFSYLIEHTANNGTLISFIIEDNYLGSFRNDSLLKEIYKLTNDEFFNE
ncbi:hypothetical protein ACFQ1M_17350 [Sungkyunkwania multivorans]|uniref:Uncharacterized protein n=1 Tax=Sungkyunkwania multivorans TaxID=1173618 RepID=A0ABW3D4N7_9FLAO